MIKLPADLPKLVPVFDVSQAERGVPAPACPNPYTCKICGSANQDVGGFWGCLCQGAENLKERFPQIENTVLETDGITVARLNLVDSDPDLLLAFAVASQLSICAALESARCDDTETQNKRSHGQRGAFFYPGSGVPNPILEKCRLFRYHLDASREHWRLPEKRRFHKTQAEQIRRRLLQNPQARWLAEMLTREPRKGGIFGRSPLT